MAAEPSSGDWLPHALPSSRSCWAHTSADKQSEGLSWLEPHTHTALQCSHLGGKDFSLLKTKDSLAEEQALWFGNGWWRPWSFCSKDAPRRPGLGAASQLSEYWEFGFQRSIISDFFFFFFGQWTNNYKKINPHVSLKCIWKTLALWLFLCICIIATALKEMVKNARPCFPLAGKSCLAASDFN